MRKKILFIWLNISLIVSCAIAQEPYYEHLSRAQGLAHDRVLCLLQDFEGYFWIGTQNGLNRFDGYQYKTYKYSPDDSLSLTGSAIRTLFEDKSHTLWVGTDGSGVNRFDRTTGTFTHYYHKPDDPYSLSHNDVYFIFEDRSGNLWVGTWGGGLNKMDRLTGKFTRYQHNPNDPHSLSDDYLQTIMQDRSGNLWIGTSYGGLNKFDPVTETFSHYRYQPNNPTSLNKYPILALAEDPSGDIWVGTDGGGLSRFNPQTSTCRQHYRNQPDDPLSLSHNNVNEIYQDYAGRWWIGTWGGGLNQFDPIQGTFQRFTHQPADRQSIAHNEIWDIMQDGSGLLWVATNGGGVTFMNINRNDFGKHNLVEMFSQRPVKTSVRAIWEDQQGEIWIGTNGEGLFHFDPLTRRIHNYLHQSKDTHNKDTRKLDPHSINSKVVSSICEDKNGDIWVGTHEGGLSRFNKKTKHFTHYLHDEQQSTSLSDNRVMVVYEDHDDDLWVGTYDQGLNLFNQGNNNFLRYVHHPDDPSTISHNAIRAIHQDRQGNIWIGTMGGGVNKLNKRTGQIQHFRHRPEDPRSISSNYIRTIYEDLNGFLWIGTEEDGLNKFDPKTGLFTRFTEKNGLPDNVVLGILPDEAGNIWLSTNNGLCRFHTETYATKNYYAIDGLQSDGFCIGSYHKGNSDKLYFGGYGGFNAFYPSTIKEQTYLAPVVITDFKIKNESRSDLLHQPLISLSSNESFFSFDFAALSYKNAAKNEYAYKLEGFDTDWIYSDSRRYASYTNLPPGTYTFKVKAANSDGVWSPTAKAIRLQISPPLWQKWWFQLAVGLAGLLAIYAGYRLRVQAIKSRNDMLEQLVQKRTDQLRKVSCRLAKSLEEAETQKQAAEFQRQQAEEANRLKTQLLSIAAHDLQNPLCGIKLYADLIKNSLSEPEKIRVLASAVENASHTMLESISKLLRSVQVENTQLIVSKQLIDIAQLAKHVVEQNKLLAQHKQQTIEFTSDSFCLAEVDAGILTEVFDNLITNAIKYSFPSTTIRVSVRRVEASIEFRVKDEGIGLKPDDIQRLFGQFRRIAPPTSGERSTGLGLFIAKQLVDLHEGKIWAESEGECKGSTFIVRIPIAVTENIELKPLAIHLTRPEVRNIVE